MTANLCLLIGEMKRCDRFLVALGLSLVPVMSWIRPRTTSVYNNCENTPSTPRHSCAAFVGKIKNCQEWRLFPILYISNYHGSFQKCLESTCPTRGRHLSAHCSFIFMLGKRCDKHTHRHLFCMAVWSMSWTQETIIQADPPPLLHALAIMPSSCGVCDLHEWVELECAFLLL